MDQVSIEDPTAVVPSSQGTTAPLARPKRRYRRRPVDRPARISAAELAVINRACDDLRSRLAWFGNDRVRIGWGEKVSPHTIEIEMRDAADRALLRVRYDMRSGALWREDGLALARLLVPATLPAVATGAAELRAAI